MKTGLSSKIKRIPFLLGILVSIAFVASGCGKIWVSVSYNQQITNPSGQNIYSGAWIGGISARYQTGVYGASGVFGPTYAPGARFGATMWSDTGGLIWIFGGLGEDSVPSTDYLNDLWKFNPATGQWAFMTGNTTIDHAGVCGALGAASTNYTPGSRQYPVSWIDLSGNLWLFGGYGYDTQQR